MSDSRYRKVPTARLSRFAAFGQLAGGVAGNVLSEGARRLARGEAPKLSDLLLTPKNATRVADQLSRLRGAAMKLGQMISLDAGDVLPRELTEILSRLRDNAHFMPPAQLERVLAAQWGLGWRKQFKSFQATPIAAASIGQVHRAVLHDGRVLAIKVQYPGIAKSIDADVDNVASLLKLTGLFPTTLDITPLLAEAKRQLHEEADYVREAEMMRRYHGLLADNPTFAVPLPHDALSGPSVLAMDFIDARPIDLLASAPQDVRERAMGALLGLALRELFEFGFMQTDPNFANFRWQPDTQRLVLLDFGAARPVPEGTTEAYRRLLSAGLAEDRGALRAALLEVGFVSAGQLERHGDAMDRAIDVLIGHIGKPGLFDFADRSFVERVRAEAEVIAADRASWHIPPMDTLFVQRKVSGTALLAIRMKAKLPLREMVADAIGESLPVLETTS
ncbi:MAG: ubiquinol-cytochrome C reductase [Novosphingobium sp. 28-62-57]|uniref:ABC1 kinase family protein n=1 Tax=unclassified Novosphingobium TaxID=2644732 RepID=UPI000BC8E1CC|nr:MULTISPECIES: AarF/ABC1/UbiB kinase family protein [unclassified Novosphingobium]OYW51481.1 MAG: ubiquinol-cytochrome C reductase [Novosphingobium sp. 12-62-10]OYZ10384.1 MAG: ubiquinol-cytochrome C reductase [Novosphingobium sp. 28-62-57]OZA40736.1 MAG: ubiquinol-cytochrome C reductase [Novosphingobium sp. 17-62-9]HQS68222.1 AarF/ABC1/UbiB kinase family protein [Novosphingobium sp.]